MHFIMAISYFLHWKTKPNQSPISTLIWSKSYELRCKLCVNGSKITEYIDLFDSYAPTSDVDSFRIIIALAASKKHWLIFYDIVNLFQTNIIEDPTKRYYFRLPPLY